jgi:hypothetical protein
VIGKGNKRDEFDQNLLCRFTEIAQWNPSVQLIYSNTKRKVFLENRENFCVSQQQVYCEKRLQEEQGSHNGHS